MVKEIDSSVRRGQFSCRFLNPTRDHAWLGLLEEQSRSVNPDPDKQAGGYGPGEKSAPRCTRVPNLSFEAPEFRKAWRAGSQVQPGGMIGRQAILCDVLQRFLVGTAVPFWIRICL